MYQMKKLPGDNGYLCVGEGGYNVIILVCQNLVKVPGKILEFCPDQKGRNPAEKLGRRT